MTSSTGTLMTPWGPIRAEVPGTDVADRILDAAAERLATQGISATTMGQLAVDAGISRAWLYRNFTSRDAVVRALVAREAHRFVVGLVGADDPNGPADELVINALVYVIDFVRGNQLIRRMLDTERAALAPFLITDLAPALQIGVDAATRFLIRRAGLPRARATAASETIVRLLYSIALTPSIGTNFDDPGEARAYITSVIRLLLA